MKQLQPLMQAQLDKMIHLGEHLFRADVSGDTLWELYLRSFEDGRDPVYRDPMSSEHNCNYCHSFMRRYGNVVTIHPNTFEIITLWDEWMTFPEEYQAPAKALMEAIKATNVGGMFFETEKWIHTMCFPQVDLDANQIRLGVKSNVKRYTKEEAEKWGVVKANDIVTFNHFTLAIPKSFISRGDASLESLIGTANSNFAVLNRGLRELNVDTLNLMLDLIDQDSLLDGRAHREKVVNFKSVLEQYQLVPEDRKVNWVWAQLKRVPMSVIRFRNELIGTLAVDLAEGKELNDACKEFNMRVDPANYMKAKAPITQRMINEANKFVQENGYNDSFQRRMAVIEDIKACDILHMNVEGTVQPVSILDNVKPTSTRHKKAEFDGVEEVTIEKFMKDILPKCTSVEAFLVAKHKKNFVSLTTPEKADSKPIMKWPNNFSWTYNGNLAGVSQIREEVKKAGGFVDAPFRFSIMWNEDGRDIVDLDAHCIEPNRTEIFYGRYKGNESPNGGQLDIDMIRPSGVGVENIFWKTRFGDGQYRFFVNNYDGGKCKNFKAEISINDEVFQYFIPKQFYGSIDIATVTIKDGELASINHSPYLIDSGSVSTEIYGLKTNEFHKVNLVCLSPNHWTEPGIGNKHYFFMLEGAMAPESIRGFHNENLIGELLNHRKVMEVLGNTVKVASTPKQLSGLGFDETVRNELILRLKGSFSRVIKVKF